MQELQSVSPGPKWPSKKTTKMGGVRISRMTVTLARKECNKTTGPRISPKLGKKEKQKGSLRSRNPLNNFHHSLKTPAPHKPFAPESPPYCPGGRRSAQQARPPPPPPGLLPCPCPSPCPLSHVLIPVFLSSLIVVIYAIPEDTWNYYKRKKLTPIAIFKVMRNFDSKSGN